MREKFPHQVYEDPILGELVVTEYNDFDSETYMFGHFKKHPEISAVVASGSTVSEDDVKRIIRKLYEAFNRLKKTLAKWEDPHETLARMDKEDNL